MTPRAQKCTLLERLFFFIVPAAIISVAIFTRHHTSDVSHEMHAKGTMLSEFLSASANKEQAGVNGLVLAADDHLVTKNVIGEEPQKEQRGGDLQRRQTHPETNSGKCTELLYWTDPKKRLDEYMSPWQERKLANKTKKYITFEPDHGGWNNVRLRKANFAYTRI